MAGRSRTSRQLFIVDLVTLILLVLIIAMKNSTNADEGSPGMREALQFEFRITGLIENDPVAPMIGVIYAGPGDPIVSKPRGLVEEPGLATLLSVGTIVSVQIYEPPGERDANRSRLILFARDRGQRLSSNLTVESRRFDSGLAEWQPVFGSSGAEGLRFIKMIENDEVDLTKALIEIDLTGVRRDGGAEPTWTPIGRLP